jgi:predicted secreted protein
MPFAADKTPITVSEAQNGDTIQLSKGRALIVRLPVQFGTGFSWAITQMTGGALRLGGTQTDSQSAGTPGASETQIFTFEAISPGTGEIEIGYRQPWMKDQPAARNFTLHVLVTGQD